MTSHERRLLFATIPLALTLVLGCLGEPIPRRVVAGTSFTLPFTGNTFGVVASERAGTLLSTDPQRGNIRFALCPTSACSTQIHLPVRYITRIFPDPGSRLGLTGNTEVVFVGSTTVIPQPSNIVGESVVVLDVPGDTMGSTYMLASFIDPPGTPPESMNILESIAIVTKPTGTADAFSNLSRLVNASDADASASLSGFVPYPQLLLSLADIENIADRPAAGNLVLQYPPSVQIQGVFESGVLGQNSIVRFKDDTANKKVTILFVDPDKRTVQLGVAFTLADPNSPVVPGAFSISSQTLYTSSGAVLPDTDVVANAGNKFKAPSTSIIR